MTFTEVLKNILNYTSSHLPDVITAISSLGMFILTIFIYRYAKKAFHANTISNSRPPYIGTLRKSLSELHTSLINFYEERDSDKKQNIFHRKKFILSLPMSIKSQITAYINSQPEPKRGDMQALHTLILQIEPKAQLWFLDGKDAEGKTVSNPNIGYGFHTMRYADGTTRDFYQIGMSANKSGISIYIFGTKDKTYLAKMYGDKIGKASVTGYCIKFRSLKDINLSVLEEVLQDALSATTKMPSGEA